MLDNTGYLLNSKRLSNLRMTEKQTIQFVTLYGQENCLWKSVHEDYKNRDARTEAAHRIADQLDMPNFGVTEVIQKFKNLRSSYCQELKKIEKSKRAGCKDDEVYKPKVIWFDIMDKFLRPHVQQRDTSEKNQNSNVEFFKAETFSNDEDLEINDPTMFNVQQEEENENISTNIPESSQNVESSEDNSFTPWMLQPKKRKLSSNHKEIRTTPSERPPSRTETPNPAITADSNTNTAATLASYEAFGRYVTASLQELPRRNAIRIKLEIQRILAQEQINVLENE